MGEPAPEREVYVFATWHEGLGAYRRDVARIPLSVLERYIVKPSVGDMPGIVEAAAVEYVRKVVQGVKP